MEQVEPKNTLGTSSKGRKNVLIMKTLWKNNLNLVQDVPTIHRNSIITIIIVSG
jgi:hypothetical protein